MKLLSAILVSIGVMLGIVPRCDGDVQLEHNLDNLLDAIAKVESNGDPNAYNVKENAVGLYQIRPIYLADVNRILGYLKYNLTDRFNAVKSREMVYVYLCHYGRNRPLEQLARIHNGGPRGYKKKSTLRYWQKVRRVMEKQ